MRSVEPALVGLDSTGAQRLQLMAALLLLVGSNRFHAAKV
jgi:hypothetical protein